MPGTIINCALILLGSLIGILFCSRISARMTQALSHAVGLCVAGIGISYAIKTDDPLCVILCMAAGTLLGELIGIERRLDRLGEWLRLRFARGAGGRFTEGFVNASVLFCVGSMAIVGSLEAGINHNYSILISKGALDGLTSITFAAAMGAGVAFSALPLFLYQGALTLLAGVAGPYLGEAVVAQMSAVGGTIITGISINMLGLSKERLRIGNMLPAIFLPIAYLPLAGALAKLLARLS